MSSSAHVEALYRTLLERWNDRDAGEALTAELRSVLHTRESFEAAKATRGLYEEYRLSTTPPDRRAELFALLDSAFAQVSVPPGAVP